MRSPLSCSTLIVALFLPLPVRSQDPSQQRILKSSSSTGVPIVKKVPAGVILVKGAWSSASDGVTPVPEKGKVANNAFVDAYFGMTYTLPPGWIEKYEGPPPSDTGRYVLAEISPADTFKGSARGSILITAQDMFFTPLPARKASELIDYMKDHLQADYQVEAPPTEIKIGSRLFTSFKYWSPVAQLHWYVLTTEIRCHALQIVTTSRDTKLLDALVQDMNKMKISGEATDAAPVCIKGYARDENMITRVDPIFTEHRFNPVPVRIIIDKEGKVKHIHFLSAFSDQAKAISDALSQWRFKPYRPEHRPIEVETGILFGNGSIR